MLFEVMEEKQMEVHKMSEQETKVAPEKVEAKPAEATEVMSMVMHDENAPIITMRKLLEGGVHFGHHTRKWNPKMGKFIYGARNGIYILRFNTEFDVVISYFICSFLA